MDLWRKQVKSDCEELLNRFQRTDSVRFDVFSKIWREMKFSHIFYGALGHEKRPFCQLILSAACSFFLPPFSFQIRVGGLYLLHSLYHCQSASPPEPIHLALKDWEHLKKFEKDAMDARHFDVVYILRQLMSHKAFYFTAMPTALCFRKKRKQERSPLCEEFIERTSRPQELINTELLEELSNIHKLYEKMKTSVSSESAPAAPSVSLIRKDFVPQLRATVLDFYKWQHGKDEADGTEDVGEGTSSRQESYQRAELLASIKSKAFGTATEASKSRRHRQVEVDSTRGEAGPSHRPGVTRTPRPSLKARTNKNVQVAGDSWKTATPTTRIGRLTSLDFGPDEEKKSLQTKKNDWR